MNNMGFFYVFYTNICLLTCSQFRVLHRQVNSLHSTCEDNEATDGKVAEENKVDKDGRVTEEAALGRAAKSLVGFGEVQKSRSTDRRSSLLVFKRC